MVIQLCLSHASGSLALRHLHPGDWLGKPDSLALRVNAGGLGTYYNPLMDKREHLMEPWSGLAECHSDRGDATTQLRLEVCFCSMCELLVDAARKLPFSVAGTPYCVQVSSSSI